MNENSRPLRCLIFRGSTPHPTQLLCTLRDHCHQRSRNARYQAGAAPYLGRSSTGWIAPACLAHSLNQLIGAQQQRFGNFQSKRLGGGEVDDEMELSRLLDRDVARLRPAQNFVDEFGGAPELIREVWAVGHERSGLDKFADTDDCRQSRAKRKRDDASTIGLNECIARNVKCVRLCLERFEGGSNILCSPDFEWRNFDAKRASHGLNLAHLHHSLGKANISHGCQPAEPGESLTQEFEPLAGKIG